MVFKSLNNLVPEYSSFFISRSDTTPHTFRDSVNKLTTPLYCHAQIFFEIVSATVVLFFGIVFLNPIQIGGRDLRLPFAKNLATFREIYLWTFWCRRDEYVNIDVTMVTEFWQPCFSKFAFSLKNRCYFYIYWLNYDIKLNLALLNEVQAF